MHFLLNTFAPFKNGLPQKRLPGGGNSPVCIVTFLLSMLSVHLSFQKISGLEEANDLLAGLEAGKEAGWPEAGWPPRAVGAGRTLTKRNYFLFNLFRSMCVQACCF